MEGKNINTSKVIPMMKYLLLAYLVTGLMLMLLAVLLYKIDLSDAVVSIGIIVVYIVSSFFAGILAGKKMKTRKFLWGLLMGVSYFAILFLVSLAVNHSIGQDMGRTSTTFLLCAGSGMLGGMLS